MPPPPFPNPSSRAAGVKPSPPPSSSSSSGHQTGGLTSMLRSLRSTVARTSSASAPASNGRDASASPTREGRPRMTGASSRGAGVKINKSRSPSLTPDARISHESEIDLTLPSRVTRREGASGQVLPGPSRGGFIAQATKSPPTVAASPSLPASPLASTSKMTSPLASSRGLDSSSYPFSAMYLAEQTDEEVNGVCPPPPQLVQRLYGLPSDSPSRAPLLELLISSVESHPFLAPPPAPSLAQTPSGPKGDHKATEPDLSPFQIYVSQSHLLDASSLPPIRLSVLRLLAGCIDATYLRRGRLKPGERAFLWDEIQRWAVEGRAEISEGAEERERAWKLPSDDCDALIHNVSALTRGGAELDTSSYAAFLVDLATQSVPRTPLPSPLADHTLGTPFLQSTSHASTACENALNLLSLLHQNCRSKIDSDTTLASLRLALTVGNRPVGREVSAALGLINSVVRSTLSSALPPLPGGPDLWAEVVPLVSRIIGCEGLVGVVELSERESTNGPDVQAKQRPSTLPATALALMLELLRCPESNTLPTLLSLLSAPLTPTFDTPVLLLVGALRSIRVARLEQAVAEAMSTKTLEDLPLSLPNLWTHLRSAMLWKSPYVDAEVVRIVLEYVDALGPSSVDNSAHTSEAHGDEMQKVSEASNEAGGVTMEEWDIAVEVLSLTKSYVTEWEEKHRKTWIWDASESSGSEDVPDESDESNDIDQFRDSPDILPAFSSLLRRIYSAWRSPRFTGPSERVWVLLMALAPNLTDEPAQAVIEHCDRNDLCLPPHPDWLESTQRVVRAFYQEAASDSAPALGDARRSPAPATRLRAAQLMSNMYARLRQSTSMRQTLVASLLLPLLEAVFEAETDTDVAEVLLTLLVDIARDVLTLVTEEEPAVGEPSLFDRIRVLLSRVAKGSVAPVDRYAVPSSPNYKRGQGSSATRYHMDSSLAGMRSSPSISAPVVGSSGSGQHAANLVDVSYLTVLALTSLFHMCLARATPSSSIKAIAVFRDLLALLTPTGDHSETSETFVPLRTRFVVLQWLVRLRADASHRVHWVKDIDISGAATILGRLVSPTTSPELATEALSTAYSRNADEPEARGRTTRVVTKERSTPREASIVRLMSPDRSLSRSTSVRNPTTTSAPPVPSLSLWHYPETLPFNFGSETGPLGDEPLASFDHNRLRHWTEEEDPGTGQFTVREVEVTDGAPQEDLTVVLPISEYLRTVNHLLQVEQEWEIVSYLLCHFPEQVSNKHFASGPRASQQIHSLRKLLCDGLRGGERALFSDVALPAGLRRSEVHATAYLLLSSLIAYRSLFTKPQQDDMVKTFMFGLGNPRDTAKVCIHALAVAAFELHPSITKHLAELVRHLQKIISSATLGVHILELIAGVGQEPSLYANFTELDFQTVFGIALKYIQAHNDRLADDPDAASEMEGIEYAFSQYVYLLAYYVICTWYMSLRQVDRPRYSAFLSRRLAQANEGKAEIDEATEVCLDMIARCASSVADPRPRHSSLEAVAQSGASAPSLPAKLWVVGTNVVAVQPLPTPNLVEVTLRRASGVLRMLWEYREEVSPDGTSRKVAMYRGIRVSVESVAAVMSDEDSSVAPVVATAPLEPSQDSGFELVESSYFIDQLSPLSPEQAEALPSLLRLPDDPATQRAIAGLDRLPVVDFHKVGVLYAGPGQHTEGDILANTEGTQSYQNLVAGLGRLVRLKDSRRLDIYAGGLDQESDIDGKWTRIWDDDISQIVFHVATLMPTSFETDPQATLKKRHIGNDFVKIIYNDSGSEFAFNTLPGDFNFVNIVIEPHTPVGNPWKAPGMTSNLEYFKVSMQRRPGMPEVGPLGAYKMVTGASLAAFVRQLSLHSDIFAQVYLDSVGFEARQGKQTLEYSSNWRQRLQQIKTLKRRTLESAAQRGDEEGLATMDPDEPWSVFIS